MPIPIVIIICIFFAALLLYVSHRCGRSSGFEEGRQPQTIKKVLDELKDGTEVSIQHQATKYAPPRSTERKCLFLFKAFDSSGHTTMIRLVTHIQEFKPGMPFDFTNGRYIVTKDNTSPTGFRLTVTKKRGQ
ncbi:MAG: hypothetical protein KBB54_04590 [Candidatus Pacebacteria bacterium]|nr:hypothetical protein [Candidatus Paceibacterota bacterium]MBP9818899.1 hypothetical protein [Candidatus Paceibacterota bacterium]